MTPEDLQTWILTEINNFDVLIIVAGNSVVIDINHNNRTRNSYNANNNAILQIFSTNFSINIRRNSSLFALRRIMSDLPRNKKRMKQNIIKEGFFTRVRFSFFPILSPPPINHSYIYFGKTEKKIKIGPEK